jgi:hypothetical protein
MLTQEEVMKMFAKEIEKNGRHAKKTARVLARQLTKPETIVTVLKDGHKETDEVTYNVGDYIIKNPSLEIYGMSQEKFEKRYNHLHHFGSTWSVYQAKGEGLFYQLDGDISFKTTWGEQHMRKGDYLCLPLPEKNEIYGIGLAEFNETYQFV